MIGPLERLERTGPYNDNGAQRLNELTPAKRLDI